MSKIPLHWLHPPKSRFVPVGFGTPWKRGKLKPEDIVSLKDGDGHTVPVQTKINAYWPDGSVKWLHHSAVLDSSKSYSIEKGGVEPKDESDLSAVSKFDGSVSIGNRLLSCTIEPGDKLISSLRHGKAGHKPLSAELISLLESRDEGDDGETLTIRKLRGFSEKVQLEEAGPVRAVVKIEGSHLSRGGKLSSLPFVIRLYFHRESAEVKMVHTFIYDGDENRDFLKGMAVQFHLEASGELWNRHVAFAGETGLFHEAVQPAYTNDISRSHPQYIKQQSEGRFINIDPEKDKDLLAIVKDNSAWGNFRLQQDSCDHYSIRKSTKPGCAPITAVQGNRSMGTLFYGDESIQISAGVKDFWQKSPMALEISGADQQHPLLTVWLWSRYAESCDFRAYDTITHRYSYGEIVNHPQGIANTNEIYIKLHDRLPEKKDLLDYAQDIQHDLLPVADPEVYRDTEVFGDYWHPVKEEKDRNRTVEKALLKFNDFYIEETERRRWYGFWDYGDVMHTYDPVRHSWRYDVCGYAWQNTELCNTYVHWLTFLRTGEYRFYRFARAMARHTSEVDIYHSGKYAMLGSRHNVRHWGCRWKEPRISMAGHHRFFYYLTGDERIGDIMDSVKDVDKRMLELSESREEGYVPVRTGPDWSSFVSNWMTHWERTGETEYRDKILAGLESIKEAPLRLSSGSTFNYDPEKGTMAYYSDGNYQYHMVICFGAPEIWWELAELLEKEEGDDLRDMMARFGEFYAMSPEERRAASGGLFNGENDASWRGQKYAVRMIAYAGYRLDKPELLRLALSLLEEEPDWGSSTPGKYDGDGNLVYGTFPSSEYPCPVEEWECANTNGMAQWSLNYMETARMLAMYERKRGKTWA